MHTKVKIVNHPTTKTDARCTEPLWMCRIGKVFLNLPRSSPSSHDWTYREI